MIEVGILLDDEREFLQYQEVREDYLLLKKLIEEGLQKCETIYEKGPLSTPVVFFILDQCGKKSKLYITCINIHSYRRRRSPKHAGYV